MKRFKNIALLVLTSLVLFGFSAVCVFREPDDYSLSERRTLAQMPDFDLESLKNGRFMTKFESYTLDQFPLRDRLRTLKAVTVRYLFGQRDNHGLYVTDGHLSKLEYPMNDKKVSQSTQKLREVYAQYIEGTDCKTFLSVVPDKNYFLAKPAGYPSMDYDALLNKLRSDLHFASYIDIFDTLSADDYYKTDQHWKQESILPTAQAIAEGLGADIQAEYQENVLDVPFYGTYVGQSALHFAPDTVRYLMNDVLNDCIVTSYDSGKPKDSFMYDMEKAHGKDPYELFLSGSDALLTVENPHAETDRELVLFRDSFGSSIAPLLVTGYRKITLVDLRYIRSELLGHFVDFTNQDVLFLYSTLIFNNNISM